MMPLEESTGCRLCEQWGSEDSDRESTSTARSRLQVAQICNNFVSFSSLFYTFLVIQYFYYLKPSKSRHKTQDNHWTFRLFVLLMFTCALPTHFAAACQFPLHWNGLWFQKGVQDPIKIFSGNISEKGTCRESNGEKFLIENLNEKCVRCMVINERHNNLLQYKETYQCHPITKHQKLPSINSICSEINGDATLYSLFRLDAKPVTCPFHGPFTFSYSRGQGECQDPVSTVETCTDDSYLQFRFQACADVYGSESRVEQLECYADWKEGSYRYLVGKLYHQSAKTDEDRFRCFVFDKIKDEPDGYEIAQSGDATCDGLLSPKDGSRTMKIHKTVGVISRCHFPAGIISKKLWKSLDGSHMYDFNQQHNNSFLVYNSTDGKVVRNGMCVIQENSTLETFTAFNYSQFVIYYKTGCKSGFVCMRIYQRSSQIIEVIYGTQTYSANDACSSMHFKTHNVKYHTLTTLNLEPQECPIEGIYAVDVPGDDTRPSNNPSTNDKNLFICSEQSSFNSRCNSNDHMQLQSRCNFKEATRNFRCLGEWFENDTHFLIASSTEDGIRQYCLVYKTSTDKLIEMTISSANCLRTSPGNSHSSFKENSHVALSLISKGECASKKSSSSSNVHITFISIVLKLLLLLQISCFC